MRSTASTLLPGVPGARRLRLGFLALTDAAPLIAAQHLGLFAEEGLQVQLTREIGWATIREKIIYGELDAAQAPAPMLWSIQLGLGCPPSEVLTALVLNHHGNALTLSRALWDAGIRDGATLRELALRRRARQPLTFGVVFTFSSHHLLLRQWLRTAGVNPERDVRIVVVPPAQMYRNLTAGTIDGYCVGEPWNSFAVHAGAGWCPVWSAAVQPGLVEKVLLVTRRFAEGEPVAHRALVRAVARACAWCDESEHREQLANWLAAGPFLNIDAAVIRHTLLGRFDCGDGRVETVPDFHVFHRGDANVPSLDRATVLQDALCAAGLLAPATVAGAGLPARLFREDLYRTATVTANAAPAALAGAPAGA